ncbi:MAG TPA: tRNA (guanosine(46)-N7)-methyltransferase TrmB, partial [Hanamia sp.]|nr:tRNA (guanosine(46)-N7)-methyltransferase TrmB [Hanamia sp.]
MYSVSLFLPPMAQKKLKRFAEIKKFANVLEYPENMNGKWHAFFKNNNPIILELACGKGEYATGLAQLYPGKNFIGVEIKGNRLWVGAKFSLDNRLNNVAFLRTQIEKINQYFDGSEIDEIWITFPDPQLRISKAKKRLTHPRFLRLYQKILREGGKIHLKT